MNLHKIINQKINMILLNKYNSNSKGLKTLDKFLESKSLHTWLSSGYYDLVYQKKSFV